MLGMKRASLELRQGCKQRAKYGQGERSYQGTGKQIIYSASKQKAARMGSGRQHPAGPGSSGTESVGRLRHSRSPHAASCHATARLPAARSVAQAAPSG